MARTLKAEGLAVLLDDGKTRVAFTDEGAAAKQADEFVAELLAAEPELRARIAASRAAMGLDK